MAPSSSLFIVLLSSVLLVLVTITLHYEALRLLGKLMPRLSIPHRFQILVVIYSLFFTHVVEMWVFGTAYFMLGDQLDLGSVHGLQAGSFLDYIYFSAVVYTSLGFGDVYPLGDLRLIAGLESLIGLLMIGWSASFTYLTMEKVWKDQDDD